MLDYLKTKFLLSRKMSAADDDPLNTIWLFNCNSADEIPSFPSDSQGTLSDISVSDLFQCASSSSNKEGCDVREISELDQDMKLVLMAKRSSDGFLSPDFPGDFNFEIGFEPQKKITKASTWTFSRSLKKLYADIGKPCPMFFTTSLGVPTGSTVRCQAVFASTIHQRDVVMRCPNHSATVDILGRHSGAPSNHFIRCDHRDARYSEDSDSGRHSVTVPYEMNGHHSVFVYRFMCRNSCLGNLNSRQIHAVFTLESTAGVTLGRVTIELRICACPGRDRRQDELVVADSSITSKLVKRSHSAIASSHAMMPKPSKSDETDNDQWYTLRVRGKKNFEILSDIKDALELRSSLTPEQRKQCRKSHPQLF